MSEDVRQSRRSLIGFAVALILGALLAIVMTQGGTLVETGQDAPGFELSGVDDERVSLESLRGKVVLLDFWATTCPPCLRQMADLQTVHERMSPRDVAVLGINTDGSSAARIRDVTRSRGARYPMLLDPGQVSERYRVTQLPTLYVIDRQGTVRWSHVGHVGHEELEAVIRGLL
jgi:peroxiredoxin